jgi:hypothetical protein
MKESNWRDKGIIALACGIGFSLIVSIIPTYYIIALFHHSTNLWLGYVLSTVAVITFEFGAVTAKVMTIWMPGWKRELQWFMICVLVMTFVANAIAGWDALMNAKLTPGSVYWYIQTTWWAWLATIAYAAIFPVFQGIFSSGFVRRWNELGVGKSELEQARNEMERLRNDLERLGLALDEALRLKNLAEQKRNEALQLYNQQLDTFQLGGRTFSLQQFADLLSRELGMSIAKTNLHRMITKVGE